MVFMLLSLIRELHYLWILAEIGMDVVAVKLSDIAMVLIIGSFNANCIFVSYCLFLKSADVTGTLFNMFFHNGTMELQPRNYKGLEVMIDFRI